MPIPQDIKGTELKNKMLLYQYENRPNLAEYMNCYIAELDTLFSESLKVYEGRLLDNAIGEQLDIIGRILQQSRNLPIAGSYFGFQGATGADSFGDNNNGTVGGLFKSDSQAGYTVAPLSDLHYRKILKVRGYCLVKNSFTPDDIYNIVNLIVTDNTVTKVLNTTATGTTLTLGASKISSFELDLLRAIKHWFVPVSIIFTISAL